MLRNPGAYRGSVSSSIDKGLFFFAVFTGAAGMVLLKYFAVPQFYITACPVIIMILYFLNITYFKRFQIREDQAGDNLYYLGFLFTLSSLSIALFQFQSAGEKDKTELIISNFGIALITTIIGLSLRVVINQMRQDPVEIEREARLTLAEVSANLRSELFNALLEFNNFRRAMQQSIAEGMEETSKRANENMTHTVEQFADTAQNVILKIDEAFESFTQNASRLNDISGQTTGAMEKLVDRIERIEAPSDMVKNIFEPAANAISETSAMIRERAKSEEEQTQRLVNMTNAAIASANLLNNRIEIIAGHAANIEQLVIRIGDLGDNFSRLQNALESTADATVKIVANQKTSLEEIVETAKTRSGDLAARFDSMAVSQGEAFKKLRDLGERYAKDAIGLTSSAAEKEAERLANLSALVQQTLESVRKHNKELEEELVRSRAATGMVLSSLTSMSDLLVEHLGGTSTLSRRPTIRT